MSNIVIDTEAVLNATNGTGGLKACSTEIETTAQGLNSVAVNFEQACTCRSTESFIEHLNFLKRRIEKHANAINKVSGALSEIAVETEATESKIVESIKRS